VEYSTPFLSLVLVKDLDAMEEVPFVRDVILLLLLQPPAVRRGLVSPPGKKPRPRDCTILVRPNSICYDPSHARAEPRLANPPPVPHPSGLLFVLSVSGPSSPPAATEAAGGHRRSPEAR
jgi:hypothetical protein